MEQEGIVITNDSVFLPYRPEETREQALINAVARYANSTEFPSVSSILAILGIERKKTDGKFTEL